MSEGPFRQEADNRRKGPQAREETRRTTSVKEPPNIRKEEH